MSVRDLLAILGIAAAAAAASSIGSLIALWRRPTTLFMSVALGFASGVLLGTIGFEMLPQAVQLGSLLIALAAFITGFLTVYGLDLFIHRGRLAGEESEQRPQVERLYRQHHLRGSDATVLAGGTSIEEVIEGLSIGAGIAISPGAGLLVALAILIDNLSEGLGIAEMIRSEQADDPLRERQRIIGWSSLISFALFGSTLVGWFILRDLPEPVLGFLFAAGGGGMFYLTVTDLIPEAEERQYQQSAAIAIGAGFLTMFVITSYF